jgi:FkbM family methyltransferase
MIETRAHFVKASTLRSPVGPKSDPIPLRLAKFGMRAARAIVRWARHAKSRENLRIIKRNMIFPVRNALLKGRPISVRAGGQEFSLVAEGAVAADTWSRSRFESHELEFILEILEPGMTFFDIGANVGLYSLAASRKVASGKVFSFEPCEWTYQRLLRNVELNGLRNVLAIRTALGEFSGDAVMQVNARGKDGLNTLGRPGHPDCEVTGNEIVPIVTLDEFLQNSKVSTVDVMKVDVEGAELSLFRGARNLLEQSAAPVILYESDWMLTRGFDYHPVETMWLLQEFGYSFFVIDPSTGKILRPPADRAYNAVVIAVKPTHPLYSTVSGAAC